MTQMDIITDPRTANAYPKVDGWIPGTDLETNILEALGPDERVVGFFETSDPMGYLAVCERRAVWFTGRLGSQREILERPLTVLGGPASIFNEVTIRAGYRTFRAVTTKKDAAEALATDML
ncbi:hypothetical protein [Georgenia soli]|nr:hypothetical protein [Georgenia soli]